jgi:hypothetical protein
MDRRKAQVDQVARNAEAAGRRAWNDAARTGQDVLARTKSELLALGVQNLPQANPVSKTSKNSTGATVNPLVTSAAQLAGNVVGIGRGVVHSAIGLGQGLLFVGRLMDPDDAELNGADQSAWGHVINAGKDTVDYVKHDFSEPSKVMHDVQNIGQKLAESTVPSATPAANTFTGEMKRNFVLGENQGELGWGIGSSLFGAAALKALPTLGAVADTGGAAKFLDQGFGAAQADYLAEPYVGVGHHFLSQAASKELRLPPVVRDSIFNVLKPAGISRGDFYELHYKVDPNFFSANLPRNVGGGQWTGSSLGLQKYGPLGGLWYGSPLPLNAAAGLSGAANLANYKPQDETGS